MCAAGATLPAAGRRVAAARPEPVIERFAALPQIVAVLARGEREAIGLTVEGVPVELVVAVPERFGTALVRATGHPSYVAGLGPLPSGSDERRGLRGAGCAWCPPELREQPFRGEPPPLVEPAESAVTCTATRRGRTAGPASRRWRAGRSPGAMSTWPSAITRRRWERCAGSARMTCAARARRSRRPTGTWRRFACCVGSSATSCPTGGWTFPTTCWPSWTGCRPASTAGSGCPAPR